MGVGVAVFRRWWRLKPSTILIDGGMVHNTEGPAISEPAKRRNRLAKNCCPYEFATSKERQQCRRLVYLQAWRLQPRRVYDGYHDGWCAAGSTVSESPGHRARLLCATRLIFEVSWFATLQPHAPSKSKALLSNVAPSENLAGEKA